MATKKAISAIPAQTGKNAPKTTTRNLKLVKPQAPPVPLKPRVLQPEKRRAPHYVLACGGHYLQEDGDAPTLLTMTPSLRNSWIFQSYAAAKIIADMANARPEVWASGQQIGNLEIHRAEIEFNGSVTGSHLFFEDDDDDIMSRKGMTRWGGNPHNTALARCAELEEGQGDVITSHVTMLAQSPMYKLLVEDYKAALAKPDGIEPDWYLTLLVARAYQAGKFAGMAESSGDPIQPASRG